MTAAEPGGLSRILYDAYDPGPPSKRCGRKVLCSLKDTHGRNMPGVLCQERFPSPELLPPNAEVNTHLNPWYTIVAEGVGVPNGDWDRYNNLWHVWPPAPPYPTYVFPQQYRAATKGLSQGGILRRSWTVTVTPGQPGTLNQDEN